MVGVDGGGVTELEGLKSLWTGLREYARLGAR